MAGLPLAGRPLVAGRVGFTLDAVHWVGVCALFAIGLTALVGWTSGHEELTRLSPAFAPVPLGAAIGLTALAIAQMMAAQDLQRAARITSLVPAALGLIPLVFTLVGLTPLMERPLSEALDLGRLDVVSATSLPLAMGLVSGAAAVWVLTSADSRSLAIGLTVPMLIVSLPAIVGHLSSAAAGSSVLPGAGFAAPAALALIASALSIGALSLAPDRHESPRWIWMPVAVGLLLVAPIVLVAQRAASDDGAGNALIETVLVMGILVASALALAFSGGASVEIVEPVAEPSPSSSVESRDNLFRALTLVAPVGIYVTDAHGQCLFVNEHWCELSGLTADEAANGDWRRALHPDDGERVLQRWKARMSTGETFDEDYRLVAPGGRTVWVEDRATPLTHEDGRLAGYVGVVMDVGARREAEAALLRREDAWRLIIDAQQAGIFDWTLGTGDTSWSPRVYELLGYLDGSFEPSPTSFSELAHPDDRIRWERALTLHLTTDAPLRVVLRLRRRTGEYRSYLVCARATRDADRRPVTLGGSLLELPTEMSVGV